MESSSRSLHVLYLGVDTKVIDFVKARVYPQSSKVITVADDFMAFIETPEGPAHFELIIAGPLLEGLPPTEIAQSLRTVNQAAPFFYCHTSRTSGFDRKTYIKNGFTDAYLMPFDNEAFKDRLDEIATQIKDAPILRPVRVVDITPGSQIPFSVHVYLPNNKKYILYAGEGKPLDAERVGRLSKHNVSSVFIPINQMQKFYDYTAAQLKALRTHDEGISETEKRARLQSAVRNLVTDIFSTSIKGDYETGKEMLQNATEIVKSYLKAGPESHIYAKIINVIGDGGGAYSHLSNTSTFAALFSMATGIGDPDELAMAGLFHDLGLSQIPTEILDKNPNEWTDEERALYEKHPEFSVNLVKEKKIVLSQNVQDMIMQHHERIDGSGFPHQLAGAKLPLDSQLLAIADEFDELTRFQDGRPSLKPLQAIQKMQNDNGYSHEILEKLIGLFQPEETQK